MAMLLSILTDKTAEHPLIEAIFTVDEESGLVGANAIDVGLLKAKRMLNLDSEVKNECTASSAAGRRMGSYLPVTFAEASGYTGFKIELSGLLGGHSGIMIHLGRANANVLLARLLAPTLEAFDVRIAQWKGGTAHNVIASSVDAVVVVPEDEADRFATLLTETSETLKAEYAQTDAGMTFAISPFEAEKAVSHEDTQHIVTMLCSIPDGLIKMSEFIENMPSVSLNTGVSELMENDFFIRTFLRSNISADIEPLYDQFVAAVTADGGRCEIESSYGAWDFAEVSPIRDQALKSYKNVLGVDATVSAVHGGLECGIFAGRIPGMDIVALGPNLLDAHSTDEKIEVQSIADLYAVTLDILKNSK